MHIEKKINPTIFSLFHHDINYQYLLLHFSTAKLYHLFNNHNEYESKIIVEVIYKIVSEKVGNNKDEDVTITLTGGMDSRLILASLLKAGFKPNCLTFGNPNSKDVVFTKVIAEKFNLKFHNACSQSPDKDWYYKWAVETIKRDHGNSHLHRAHRTAAIAEHAELYNPKILFTGHMGGEGLRGLTYNNYFASPFFELVNQGKMEIKAAAEKVLNNYFIKTESLNIEEIVEQVKNLVWMRHDKRTNKFYFLYDLVAKIHHSQDLRLYNSYVPEVVPVFLQKKYLETLFASSYNFLKRKQTVFSRLKNPEFYCKAIEYLYPPLLDVPYANGYTPNEYLKGLWYYVPMKLYRDLMKKKKYPPSFSYGKWYVEFVKEHSRNIREEIWEIYDKKRYFEALENNEHRSDEGYWHKFSNPIFFDLVEKYKKGLI